jgi:hypothetical protein
VSDILKNKNYQADVMRSAASNHIWLNAFACVRPTDKFCADVGRQIIGMLSQPENLIEPDEHLCKHERELIVRINKS